MSKASREKPTRKQLAQAYTELGLAKGAGLEQVKAAYRRLARTLHPDLNPGQSGQRMSQVNQAYQMLLRHLEAQKPRQAATSHPIPRPQPLQAEQPLPLAGWRLTGIVRQGGGLLYQVQVKGQPQEMDLPLRRRSTCQACQGQGWVQTMGYMERCPLCGGRGAVVSSERVRVPLPQGWQPGQQVTVPSQAGPITVQLNRVSQEEEV